MKTVASVSTTAALASVLLSGCAFAPRHASVAPEPTPAAVAPANPAELQRDRAAILAMLGEYEVRFAFDETVVLKAGYARVDAKTTGAWETVVLVEDAGDRIVLQHLLVGENGHVTKHWRQDWQFEARERFEFVDDQTWRRVALDPETTRGAWTQCVFEVSDAPRYCGTGRWVHTDGHPTWTSDPTWRPLPRREYTTRKDYDALRAINRHTVSANGWTHEQDNTKAIRDGGEVTELVREFGFNDYRRVAGHDFEPAYAYWRATGAFWADVRRRWGVAFAAGDGVRLKTKIDGMAIVMPLFKQAALIAEGKQADVAKVDKVFATKIEVLAPEAGLATVQ